jgi:CDP-6-deoxy-D-xylo-4-hexulose-3-dehydrase
MSARQQLRSALEAAFAPPAPEPFHPRETRIPLIATSYGVEEVWEALDSMIEGRVTMGEKVARFEAAFASYLGVRHAVMVNSGSSANLLALAVLTSPASERPLHTGDEVITPAVTWATTVWPIAQQGLVPVLVDVEPHSFNIDPEQIERAITPSTRAIMLVHLLGRPCEMDAIVEIARRHELALIEDACEAHGAEHRGRKVGSLGDMATFSFYFSHHITTIEGGMVVTDSDAHADLARRLRAFGWTRGSTSASTVEAAHPEIDPRFLFATTGYNMRPTELQAAFGLHQLPQLDGYVEQRRENATHWAGRLASLGDVLTVQTEAPATRHAWFGYPLTIAEDAPFARDELVAHLERMGVETRPVMAGNIVEQPAMAHIPHRVIGTLPHARAIHRRSLFFGNHQGVGEGEREAVAAYLEDFVSSSATRAA